MTNEGQQTPLETMHAGKEVHTFHYFFFAMFVIRGAFYADTVPVRIGLLHGLHEVGSGVFLKFCTRSLSGLFHV